MKHTHKITLGIADTEVTAEVTFTKSATYAATGPTFSSGGEPGGGGEVEVEAATIIIGNASHPAPQWLLDLLGNDDSVIEELSESVDEYDGIDWDARRDARMDDAA